VLLGHPDQALKDLADPSVGNRYDAPLWRAMAHAGQGRWVEANEGFKNVETATAELPIELQRLALKEAVRCAIEIKDFSSAARRLNEFDGLGLSNDLKPALAVLSGRVAEGLGRLGDALSAYRSAAESTDAPAAAQARLREIALRYSLKEVKREAAIAQLEMLTAAWRGDRTEIEALHLLQQLYIEEQRYRDAFQVMRVALAAHASSDITRRIQDDAAASFESLFLSEKGDALAPIESLGLFYDFRALTPVGHKGDEMIRRLAERLVTVDLLTQATELLQHQVDNRLQGVARAQVATRLATIYLMNRKPDRALHALRATRQSELSADLRAPRLMIEARALSDIGRHDVALDVVANLDGRESERLRADIQWAARRWRDSAEVTERFYGERWKEFAPLDDGERADVLRGAIGYALAEDRLGTDRFRQKYAAKMAEGPDGRMFDVVTAPLNARTGEFTEIAKTVASVDTLGTFLKDLRARYPETGGALSSAPQAPRS
jgi:tetratricopeptide (TPR) repeat protein